MGVRAGVAASPAVGQNRKASAHTTTIGRYGQAAHDDYELPGRLQTLPEAYAAGRGGGIRPRPRQSSSTSSTSLADAWDGEQTNKSLLKPLLEKPTNTSTPSKPTTGPTCARTRRHTAAIHITGAGLRTRRHNGQNSIDEICNRLVDKLYHPTPARIRPRRRTRRRPRPPKRRRHARTMGTDEAEGETAHIRARRHLPRAKEPLPRAAKIVSRVAKSAHGTSAQLEQAFEPETTGEHQYADAIIAAVRAAHHSAA